jgi:hypothetical protein
MTPELQSKVALWRQKAAAGQLSREEMIEAVAALREGRKGAAAATAGATKSRAKAATPAPSGDDLLGEMMEGI